MRWIYTKDADGFERLMDPFLRRLAHDLRGHAGIVSSSLDQAREPGAPLDTLLPIAMRGAQKLLRLSEKIALFSEIQRQGVVLMRAPTDVGLLLADVTKKTNESSSKKSIALTHQSVELPPLSLDGRLLGNALVEIGLNAIRFAKTQAHLDVTKEGDGIAFSFQDDGPGFADDFDVDSPATTNGLGISLPVAAEIVRAHGGTLTTQSSKGALVRVRIPKLL